MGVHQRPSLSQMPLYNPATHIVGFIMDSSHFHLQPTRGSFLDYQLFGSLPQVKQPVGT